MGHLDFSEGCSLRHLPKAGVHTYSYTGQKQLHTYQEIEYCNFPKRWKNRVLTGRLRLRRTAGDVV